MKDFFFLFLAQFKNIQRSSGEGVQEKLSTIGAKGGREGQLSWEPAESQGFFQPCQAEPGLAQQSWA